MSTFDRSEAFAGAAGPAGLDTISEAFPPEGRAAATIVLGRNGALCPDVGALPQGCPSWCAKGCKGPLGLWHIPEEIVVGVGSLCVERARRCVLRGVSSAPGPTTTAATRHNQVHGSPALWPSQVEQYAGERVFEQRGAPQGLGPQHLGAEHRAMPDGAFPCLPSTTASEGGELCAARCVCSARGNICTGVWAACAHA